MGRGNIMRCSGLRAVQKLWLRLSINHISRHGSGYVGHGRGSGGFLRKKKKDDQDPYISVEVVSAVTGEVTKALACEESRRKYIKWLSYRNSRAQLDEVILPVNSTWFKMLDDAWKDYPVIIKVGEYKAPYVIDHVSPKVVERDRTYVSLYLKTVDNIQYLEDIAAKKEMSQELLEIVKAELAAAPKKKLAKKRKKRLSKWEKKDW
jgi:hypothetical protein